MRWRNHRSLPHLHPEDAVPTYGSRIRGENEFLRKGREELHELVRKPAVKFGCGLIVALAVLGFAWFAIRTGREIVSLARAQRFLEHADREVDAKHFAASIPLYSAAIRENLSRSERGWAYARRGWAEVNEHHDDYAIRDFSRALDLTPDLGFARLDRGLAYHRRGNFDAALADYSRVIAADPNSLDAYRNRALIFGDRGRLKEAIADMSEAIRCAPNDPRWFVRRAEFFARDGDFDAALASFASAIRLDPEDASAYFGRAEIFRRRNAAGRGISEVSQAITERPMSARLRCARGLVHLVTYEADAAASDFDEAIRLQPHYAMAFSNRGSVELLRGNADVALAYATRALSFDSKSEYPHLVRGRAYTAKREFTEAIAEFEQAIALEPGFVPAIIGRAMAKGYAGDCAAARRELEEAVQRFSGWQQTHSVHAWFLATCPNPSFRNAPAALAEAHLAVELSHGDPYSYDALAASYAEGGDFIHAQEAELEAIAKLPEAAADRVRMQGRLELFRHERPYRDFP